MAVRVSARGYRHDGGLRTILDEQIIGIVNQEQWSEKPNTLYLKKDKGDGRISMRIGPKELRFGGSYTLYVDLSEDDVVKLVLECFPQIRTLFPGFTAWKLWPRHKANEAARKHFLLEELPNKVKSEIADNVIDLNRIRSE
jgi:hypothetical protein